MEGTETGSAAGYDKTLEGPWRSYREWAGTSRQLKADLQLWTVRSLKMGITGAILAAAGQQLSTMKDLAPPPEAVKLAGALATVCVGMSAYFGKESVTGENTANWVKSRSAAESIKTLIYLYRAGVPPFDAADKQKLLVTKVGNILDSVKQLEALPVERDKTDPDLLPLTVDTYMVQRVDDQIGYYRNTAAKYHVENKKLRDRIFLLGGVSVALTAIAALVSVSALAGLIATLTASSSAYAQNQRYQALIAIYQATAQRLELLKSEWQGSGRTESDTVERNAFIRSCEDVLAMESGAWSGEWAKKPAAAVAQK